MMKPIPYGRQDVTDEDILSVVETLRADYLTQGPKIDEFEEAFAAYVGAKYAVAVSNGTAGLHLSILALGIEEGDKVITTPITFAASANCIRYCGGEVVFADIDPESFLLNPLAVKQLLEQAPAGTYKGIIPVDFAGRAVNLEVYREIADEFGLWIIEDACHSPGGYFIDSSGKQQLCGNGVYADLSVFSFHPVKHIAAGEGGMVTTNSEPLYQRLRKLRTHGITREQQEYRNSPEIAWGADGVDTSTYPGWYMEMQELGFNYRITDFQCALGTSQLHRANLNIKRRREIAARYDKKLKSLKGISSQSGVVDGHAYHLYVIEVEDRAGLYEYLRENKIFTQVHYFPCHLMPYYRKYGWKEGDLPVAENYYKQCLSLPMYPTLTDNQQDYIMDKIQTYYQ